MARLLVPPRRVFGDNEIEDYGDDFHRHVDEEYPAPARRIGDVSAYNCIAHTIAIAATPNAAPRFSGAGGIENDRLLLGPQAAAEKPLQEPKHDEFGQTVRRSAQKREYREHG